MQTPAIQPGDGCIPPTLTGDGRREFGREVSPEHRAEFEDALSYNLPRFRRMALRWLRNPEDAEDAVQDAMLSAFKHIARFEGRAQMSTWLMSIVINAVRMQIRRRPRYTILALDQPLQDEEFTLSDLIADPRPTPEQTLGERQVRDLIIKLSRNLPPSQLAAMQLRQRDGLSVKDAAAALGVPLGTLKAQLARGRVTLTQRLRRALGESRPRKPRSGSKAGGEASSSSRCRRDFVEGSQFDRSIRNDTFRSSREVAVEVSSVPA